ncbi:MAG: hypothetical protein WCK65_13370 [Rhodospirillaceae bacterium]
MSKGNQGNEVDKTKPPYPYTGPRGTLSNDDTRYPLQRLALAFWYGNAVKSASDMQVLEMQNKVNAYAQWRDIEENNGVSITREVQKGWEDTYNKSVIRIPKIIDAIYKVPNRESRVKLNTRGMTFEERKQDIIDYCDELVSYLRTRRDLADPHGHAPKKLESPDERKWAGSYKSKNNQRCFGVWPKIGNSHHIIVKDGKNVSKEYLTLEELLVGICVFKQEVKDGVHDDRIRYKKRPKKSSS